MSSWFLRSKGGTEERGSPVVARPGCLLAVLIVTCLATGYTIYWLLKSNAI